MRSATELADGLQREIDALREQGSVENPEAYVAMTVKLTKDVITALTMTAKKEKLLKLLLDLSKADDMESAHKEADAALIQYIADPEIEAAYREIPKWYA